MRLEQLELLDHMPSLCETQLLKQTKPLHPFLVHCVASVTTQHAQERNIEMSLNCAPSRLDVDHNIILAHDLDLLLELTGTDVITADLMSLRQGNNNQNNKKNFNQHQNNNNRKFNLSSCIVLTNPCLFILD